MVEKEGFSSKRIEALLHSMELSLCHISSNFGLGLAQRIIQSWITINSSPVELMKVQDRFEGLRSTLKITNGDHFKLLLRKYLLDNPMKLSFLMEADSNYHENESKQEEARLKELQASMTDKEKNQIVLEANSLKDEQQKDQGLLYFFEF